MLAFAARVAVFTAGMYLGQVAYGAGKEAVKSAFNSNDKKEDDKKSS